MKLGFTDSGRHVSARAILGDENLDQLTRFLQFLGSQDRLFVILHLSPSLLDPDIKRGCLKIF